MKLISAKALSTQSPQLWRWLVHLRGPQTKEARSRQSLSNLLNLLWMTIIIRMGQKKGLLSPAYYFNKNEKKITSRLKKIYIYFHLQIVLWYFMGIVVEALHYPFSSVRLGSLAGLHFPWLTIVSLHGEGRWLHHGNPWLWCNMGEVVWLESPAYRGEWSHQETKLQLS